MALITLILSNYEQNFYLDYNNHSGRPGDLVFFLV